MKHVVVN